MRDGLACAVTVLLFLSPPAGVHTVDASDQPQGQGPLLSFEDGVNQCINRVSTLPKREAYRSLCSNIESVYEQNQQSANTIVALQVVNANMQAQAAQLRDRDLAVQAQAQAANAQIQTEEQQLQASADQIHNRAVVLERAQQQERVNVLAQQKRQERRTSLLERALRAARQTERQQVSAFQQIERQQVSAFQRKERELELVTQQSMVLHRQSMMLHQQAEQEIASTEARIALKAAEREKELREKVHEASGALKVKWEKWEQQWVQHWKALEPKLAALESENAALRKEMEHLKSNMHPTGENSSRHLKGENQQSLLEQLRALQTENAQLVQQCG